MERGSGRGELRQRKLGKELAIRDKITAITAIAILIPPMGYHIVTALSNGRIA